ncbi:hypothetical protein [Methylococcus sp. Mc7]|jgi:TolA-binding protein|uniref:hypothetical protein n=1 Tax=Methylococcus sp. Mc7 TaxID=2860258 RepID=UPI001C52C0D7|nr:hypothetical protein [Methylococcus sp. Mc7]QXP83907.1 hypothetical protein KW115_17525 [Methylococcus sp. Mc7]
MKKSLISLLFILLAVAALDTQARGGGQDMSPRQGGMGDTERDRMCQHQSGQNQEGAMQQSLEMNREQNREMNQEQNRMRQTAP